MIWVPNYLSPGQDSPNPGRGLTALCTPADFHHSSARFDIKRDCEGLQPFTWGLGLCPNFLLSYAPPAAARKKGKRAFRVPNYLSPYYLPPRQGEDSPKPR